MVKVDTNYSVEYTASIIWNKWKVLILRYLINSIKRYNELNRSVVGISAKILAQNLNNWYNEGLVKEKVYSIVPLKIKCSLTERDALDMIKEFDIKYRDQKWTKKSYY